MVEKREVSLGLGSSWIFFAILAFILAYFQYGFSVNAGLGMILIALALDVLSLLGLIPFIGFIIYYLVAVYWLLPQALNFVQLGWSWTVDLFLYLNLIFAFIMTVFSSYFAYEVIS
ncbi:MAG: hypothetical protein DRO04_01375 [Candidatus Iainarchaeum archaeon]|uniref:Uncharacterized protein n=1 Tax=Candidatus Iainarchaeum sp. TaxID=3101447 RepID=A0A497JHQ8_9ARCH|nr:MAG: hypothetical protein DRO04_01375 [Candidatus Diapherotrites archaeon]